MATPPLRSALSDTYPNPSNSVMRTGMGALWDYVTTLLGATGTPADARAALGLGSGPLAGLRNVAINGGFTINQRAYVSAAVLAAGSYGHDRWKAGSGGGDYSFTQLASNTTITIAANKTLIQVVEDKNVQATSYVVSWTGTALGRVGVNTATPAGAYAASPILITGQTAGTTMSVEFGNGASAGTLGKVMIEPGTVVGQATPFEHRPYGMELALCQRYFELFGLTFNTLTIFTSHSYKVSKRVSPTLAIVAGSALGGTVGGMTYYPTESCRQVTASSGNTDVQISASAEL